MIFMAIFTGSGVAVITPLRANKEVDFDALGNLVEWHIAEGTDCIVVCGTTGEAATLSFDERIDVIKFVVDKAAKRVPVIAGAGSNDTKLGVLLAQRAADAGASAILNVTPYYNKATPKGLIRHYMEYAENVNIPSILYSVPSRTGVNITPAIAKELKKHPNIIGIKEASGNISQIVEMARLVDDDFALYSGNDDHVLPILALGGSGVISTIANILPKDTHDLVAKYFAGDIEGSRAIQLKQKPLIDAIFSEVNPIPVKAAVHLMGKCDLAYRLPMCEPEDYTIERLKKEMHDYGIL